MEQMIENEHEYDVIVDDGGRIYKLAFIDGRLDRSAVIADFLEDYDGRTPEDINVIFRESNVGCGGFAEYGGHEYAIFSCDCGAILCWGCSVKCTDDSSGEGVFTCPNCGHSEAYPFQQLS